MSVICKVVVEGKGRDQSTERGSVHDEKQRAEYRALGNTARRNFNNAFYYFGYDRKVQDWAIRYGRLT